MNILFIWIGMVEPLYDWRHRCIFRAKEMYPDAKFQCVTTLKEFYGMEIVDAREVAEKMEEQGYYGDITQFIPFSDALRFWWLSKQKNTLYLDTDTWCKTPLNPHPNAGKAGIEALWNGENTSVFKDFLDKRRSGEIFVGYRNELDIDDLTEYFEHKPKWAKSYMERT